MHSTSEAVVGIHEEVDAEQRKSIDQEQDDHHHCRLMPLPISGQALMKKPCKQHPANDTDKFFGIVIEQCAPGKAGTDKSKQ